ncbi:hypothetical protein [Rhizobium miluonense]|uniref:Uncharacterized protein n=1 Tax=Rhizobium miluonense TaxID=411945 RepID=A0A1C3WP40_9HYPH|nr:hypothetical protein [Rhizobium miluonense]SCB41787.1 hypothetical protein GA0061102_103517 [Rhizobium miluonense]
MTSHTTAIREAIYSRLENLPGYVTIRKQGTPTLSVDDLPALSIFIADERLDPDGDANAGPPKFGVTATIIIAVSRGFDDPSVTDGIIDADIDAIENTLLTDPTFVGFGTAPDARFESINGIRRRRIFEKEGESYFLELQLEFQFFYRWIYDPIIRDDLQTLSVTAKPNNDGTADTFNRTWTVPTS